MIDYSSQLLHDHGPGSEAPALRFRASVDAGSVAQTLEAMLSLAQACALHEPIIGLARSLVRELPGHDQLAEVRAFFNWVKGTCRYTRDPRGLELLQPPCLTAWSEGQGDCDDLAMLIAALAESVSLPWGFRVVSMSPLDPDTPSHVYPVVGARVGDQLEWFAADVVHPDGYLGWEPPHVRAWDWIPQAESA